MTTMTSLFDPPEVEACLAPTETIDSRHPSIVACAMYLGLPGLSPRERATRIFEFVRDKIDYVFMPSLEHREYVASRVLQAGRGFCVQKAILLCALGRAAEIPTALVLSDLHDATLPAGLANALGTRTLNHHGLNALELDGRWLLADASLPRALCERRGHRTVRFDGSADALIAPTDLAGKPHAVYERIHGAYADFPWEQMLRAFWAAYGNADRSALERLGFHIPTTRKP